MKYSLPIDVGFYQMYADALNAAANTSTGAQRVAPDMQKPNEETKTLSRQG